ncbi:MAG: T9SS type A sorting domain-containing protein [Crocinitomicaceae bacterium]|nr:T9SS type A sorting domain-containing protein [Crocinitomicaceae bacterium]
MNKVLILFSLLISVGSFGQWQFFGSPAFSPGQVQYTSLAVDGSTPYVAYRDLANMNKCSVMKHNGTNWVQVGSAGISGGGALYTSLAIDNGFPFVAYVDGSAVNRVTVKAFNGTSWVTIGSTGFSGDNTSYVNLKIESSVPYVAYQDGSNGNKVSVMKFNGTSWEQVGNAGFSADVATEISLTVLGGTPYVSYKDAGVSNELSIMYFDGTNWQYMGPQGITSGGVGKTSIANNGSEIYLAYEDAANSDKITVMKYFSGWQLVGSAGFTPGAADYIDLEFLGADPYVAYQDASYGFRANVMWFDGTDWLEIGVPGFSPSQALFTSLAFEGGYPLVAFQDYDGGTYKASVMKYEPCFDADVPALSLSATTICQNMPLTLSVTSGNLNSADYWSVYSGSCGGTLIGSFTGSSAILLPQGNTTYYVRGEPYCVMPNSCASISVSVTPIDSSVTVSGGTMTAVSSTATTYQWLNCGTGYSVISGENSQSFSPSSNGSYALKISENGCVDTSSCYTFSSIGWEENKTNSFALFPNPAADFVNLSFDASMQHGQILLSDLAGKVVYQSAVSETKNIEIDLRNLESGHYFVTLISEEQTQTISFTKK